MGIMAALVERSKSGKGQVIDASMVEGAAYVSSWIYNSQVSKVSALAIIFINFTKKFTKNFEKKNFSPHHSGFSNCEPMSLI